MSKAAIQMTATPPTETPTMRPVDVELEEQQSYEKNWEMSDVRLVVKTRK
jgi:hypothetical protein